MCASNLKKMMYNSQFVCSIVVIGTIFTGLNDSLEYNHEVTICNTFKFKYYFHWKDLIALILT